MHQRRQIHQAGIRHLRTVEPQATELAKATNMLHSGVTKGTYQNVEFAQFRYVRQVLQIGVYATEFTKFATSRRSKR